MKRTLIAATLAALTIPVVVAAPAQAGIHIFNDEMAVGLLASLQSGGRHRVPQDVSVIGFDDIFWAGGSVPALTTVRLDKCLLGRLAANQGQCCLWMYGYVGLRHRVLRQLRGDHGELGAQQLEHDEQCLRYQSECILSARGGEHDREQHGRGYESAIRGH